VLMVRPVKNVMVSGEERRKEERRKHNPFASYGKDEDTARGVLWSVGAGDGAGLATSDEPVGNTCRSVR